MQTRMGGGLGLGFTTARGGGDAPEARRNLFRYSEQFENSAWGSINTGGTGLAPVITADAALSPAGDTTADRIVFSLNGGTSNSDISRRIQLVTPTAGTHTYSFWIRSFDGVSSYTMFYSDATGLVNFTVTGDWQRFTYTATYVAASTAMGLGLRGGRTPANSNTADVLVWGAQLELGAVATDYQRVITASDPFVTRPVAYRDVFLMAGQSNLAGRAPYDGLGVWPSGTEQYTQAGAVAVLTGNSLDHPGMNTAQMGVDISFAQSYKAANPSSTILFVPQAPGSTGFQSNDWNPGDTEYDSAVSRTNAVLDANPGIWQFKGIIWLQGEQDSLTIYSTTEASHAAALDAMIAGFRSEIRGATNIPFVLGQIPSIGGAFFDKQTFVRAAIADTPNRVTDTAFAANTGLTKLGDGLHYDAASLRTMGVRLYDGWDSIA